MAVFLSARRFLAALAAEDFPLPANCAEARLVMRATSPCEMEYRVFLSPADLAKVGRALQRMAEPEGGV